MDVCGYVKDMGKQLGSDPMPPKDSVRDTLKFLVGKLVMCPPSTQQWRPGAWTPKAWSLDSRQTTQ